MKHKSHIYHKENCDNRLRDTMKDFLGRLVVLSGRHAFEWTITIYDEGITTARVTRYPNSKAARQEFNKLKKAYKK